MNVTAFSTRADINEPIQSLIFALAGERFAIPADMVREILDPVAVTAVPGARPYVDGLINVRGKVAPLADLRVRLGMAVSAATVDTRFVVVEIELSGEPVLVGLHADKVHEVTAIEPASIEDVPAIGLKWRREFIAGIGKVNGAFIMLPDIANVFGLE